MIGVVLALALFTISADRAASAEQTPEIDLDPCLQVDTTAVRDLVDLQIRDAGAVSGRVPVTVIVRCVGERQEIRVEPWISLGQGGTRTIQLPAPDEEIPAAQEARSRELGLAISELILRLEMAHPLVPEPPAPSPPPLPAQPRALVKAVPPAPPALVQSPPGRWQTGILSAVESFGGGQTLAGVDLLAAARIRPPLVVELRIGGRLGSDVALSWVRVTSRAETASLAVGADRWSARRSIGVGVMVRAEGVLVDFRSDYLGAAPAGAAQSTALVVAAEPRVWAVITGHVAVMAAAAAGLPIHGIVLRTRGIDAASLTGRVVSANLGVLLTF